MKKIITLVAIAGFSFALLSNSNYNKQESYANTSTTKNFTIPENIQVIIDNKCYDCHNNDARGKKSKMKLNFDKFTNGKYSTGKIVGKLSKIKKVLSKDKMPPSKFVAKYPEQKLTASEKETLATWAKQQIKELSK